MPSPAQSIALLRASVHAAVLQTGVLREHVPAIAESDEHPPVLPLWTWFFPMATAAVAILVTVHPPRLSSLHVDAQSPMSIADVALTPSPEDTQFLGVSAPPVVIARHITSSSSAGIIRPKTLSDRIADRRTKREAFWSMHAAAPSTQSNESPLPRADNKIGVYVTARSVSRREFLEKTIVDLGEAGGTSLVFDVKGSAVFFHSAAPMATEADLVVPTIDLPEVLQRAKEQGLYTIGRFVAIKDYGITEKKPETRVRDPEGKRVLSENWVDPANDTAIEYNMQIICELAASGIDEINLDYIRFSTAEVGALRVYSGEQKADRLEKFIRAARDTINRCGPRTRLGLSTYAILGWRYDVNMETLGQDVVRFAPLVDVISPMAYPATFAANAYYAPGKDPGSRMYYLVYRTLTGYRDLLGPEHASKIRPWIQGYGVTRKNVEDEIRAVYDAGACGFQVWNADNAYAVTWVAMKHGPQRPERCRE